LGREAQQGVERILEGQWREIEHEVEVLLAPGLQILARQLQGVHEQGARVGVGPRLERQAGGVRETGAALTRSEEHVFIARERDLEQVRAALGRIPLQLPTPERLADSRARLDAAVRSLFRDRAADLERQGQMLLAPGLQALDRRLGAIHEQGGRLTAGTRRELTDHERDYTRATRRMVGDSRQVIARGLADRLGLLGRLGGDLGMGVTAQLGSAQREAGHLAALIKALDQRSRGWVLPQDENGQVIKFPPGAPVGNRFSLNFRDGRQWVVAENIELEEESR
jgi:exonuclease VII large subunit